MTESGPEDARVIALIRLSGARFDSVGIPADALAEVAALEDILRSLVRLYWRDRNSGRKRIPKGYDDQITLRLTTIGDGSAIPVLEYDSALDDGDLFGPYELKQDFSRAVGAIEEFVNSGITDSNQIPNDIRRLPANTVKKFGQTIRKDEAIQLAAIRPSSWDSVAQYTPDSRREALVNLIGSFTRRVTIQGKVTEFNVAAGRILVRDREQRRDIPVPYFESGLAVRIDSEFQLFECEAEGVGEFNADGRLTRLVSVDSLYVTEVTEDARAARAKLESLGDLEAGWLDGENGSTISRIVIERGHAVIDAIITHSSITRTISPTDDGGVSFFWPDMENQLSIEVEPSGALYIHTVDLLAGTFSDRRISADILNLVETLDPWLVEVADE